MENVKESTDELLRMMGQELRLVDELIGFAQEKALILARADVTGLNDLLAKEEETVLALREREAERNAGTKSLAAVLGIPDENLTLKKLTENLNDPECGGRLIRAGSEMLQKTRKLSRHQEKVGGLLKHRAAYTDFMLNLLCGSQNKVHFYNMQGIREERESAVSRLDYHA